MPELWSSRDIGAPVYTELSGDLGMSRLFSFSTLEISFCYCGHYCVYGAYICGVLYGSFCWPVAMGVVGSIALDVERSCAHKAVVKENWGGMW